ncbi:MAG: hypothetical protein IJV35_02945 [Neisseriaceae bacterium]|nr:hypothetical protein [Neisseriaceae bacterium]
MAWGVFRLPEKTFCDMSLYLIGYPKIIFNFVSLVKNNFRRLPRRAYGTARNDEWRQPEIIFALPFSVVRRLLRLCFETPTPYGSGRHRRKR